MLPLYRVSVAPVQTVSGSFGDQPRHVSANVVGGRAVAVSAAMLIITENYLYRKLNENSVIISV